MKKTYFGAYNVPPLSEENMSASFTTPGNISKEIFENIVLYGGEAEETEKQEEQQNNFDSNLKAILSVPIYRWAWFL